MEVVQELGADQGMSNLHHSVAELERVHEQHERRHDHPVLPTQGVPVVSPDLDLPGQRGVESAEARRQHLRRDDSWLFTPVVLSVITLLNRFPMRVCLQMEIKITLNAKQEVKVQDENFC